MPDTHTWDNIATFLVQHNRAVRRRKRLILAAWIGTPVVFVMFFSVWFVSTQKREFGIAEYSDTGVYDIAKESLKDFYYQKDDEINKVQPIKTSNAGNNLSVVQSAPNISRVNQADGNHSYGSRTTSSNNLITGNNENTTIPDQNQDITRVNLNAKVSAVEEMESAISLPAQILLSEPGINMVDIADLPSSQMLTPPKRQWSLDANIFAQGYSVNEILPQKNVPVESSRTLSNMMLFVPGGGITFQKAVFSRPHQFGTGLLLGYGRRWAIDLRIGYYGVTSEQKTDTVMGYSALKYARFNSINTYAGARYNFISRPKFTTYFSAGFGTTSAINNQFELIQFENSTIVNRENITQEIQGFKFSGDLGVGFGFKLLPRVSVFAEANVHHTKGEIRHPNVPSFFNDTFLSARTGIQFNLK